MSIDTSAKDTSITVQKSASVNTTSTTTNSSVSLNRSPSISTTPSTPKKDKAYVREYTR